MALSNLATTRYLSSGEWPYATFPLTLFCWHNASSTSSNNAIFGLATSAASTTNYIALRQSATAGMTARITSGGGNSTSVATGLVAGVWQPWIGVFTSTTVQCFGISNTGPNNSHARTPTTPLIGYFGNIANAGVSTHVHAEMAIWDYALNAGDVAALLAGVSPKKVRPQNLRVHFPAVRGLGNSRGPSTLTGAAPTVVAHPRIYL